MRAEVTEAERSNRKKERNEARERRDWSRGG